MGKYLCDLEVKGAFLSKWRNYSHISYIKKLYKEARAESKEETIKKVIDFYDSYFYFYDRFDSVKNENFIIPEKLKR